MKYLLPAVAVLALVGQGCMAPAPVATPETPPVPTEQTTESTNQESMSPYTFPGVLPEEQTAVKVRVKTTKGDIVLELLPQEAPNAASNFVYLTKEGFYNGLKFHRREEGFVIQGGDPMGNGMGGPGYQFPDDAVRAENPQAKPFELDERFVVYTRGTLAMANAGPNTNGSQFFIMLDDKPLPPAYSVFGRVVEGMDVVDAIAVGDAMTEVTVE
jgi:cyclophilin family peptidyl-prolyl cis-trans isomerase